MGYDDRMSRQEQVITTAVGYVGRLRCDAAEAFAERQEATITYYNPTRDEWHLSNGEIYSTSRIIMENAEEIFKGV